MKIEDSLNDPELEQLMDQRQAMLESLAPVLTRKLYFALEERLRAEKADILRLTGSEQSLRLESARYTDILDGQYFQQEFFEAEEQQS